MNTFANLNRIAALLFALGIFLVQLACSPMAGGIQETVMDRDSQYHAVLQSFERMEAVWKQQPDNVAALQQNVNALQSEIKLLREAEDGTEIPEPTDSKESATSVAKAKKPSAPVRPSGEPSPEQRKKIREEATEGKFLSGGLLEETEEKKSLKGVPDAWIEKSCNEAEEELARFHGTLDSGTSKSDVEKTLTRLRKILYQLGNPPQTAPK
jgi:hypothetical protein